MSAIIAFVLTHNTEILAALMAIHAAAVAIVNLTPTPKDNETVAKAYRIIEIFAGIVTRFSKM